MHELSLAEELVARCRALSEGRQALEVWVRCPASVDAAELVEGFGYLVHERSHEPGADAIAGAELKVETVPVRIRCPCGFSGELGPDDCAGHMSICPSCGRTGELEQGVDLLAISYALSGPAGSGDRRALAGAPFTVLGLP
jgi:Zn finger protein HypA/HybF involved in hydrogenase expression